MKNSITLIIGLGNPGEEYKKNRHNVGFIFLDKIKQDFGFSDFEFNKKFNAKISEKKQASFIKKIFSTNKKIILVKPQTFMNRSGEAIQKIISFYKITSKNIIVIHDDLDIPIGSYKISTKSSAGGHNGVQDIINKIGNQDFTRIRIGIEKKDGRQSRKIPGQKFVLQNFTEEELASLEKLFKDIDIVHSLLSSSSSFSSL
ncbi:MAG TPA: aminoacyl-tRNA hydrolase [Candidatus Moranbacteria bacterium]|nr:aminoacyl-tRNA hydrolase [Candidatus Moranbacteria bacterium]